MAGMLDSGTGAAADYGRLTRRAKAGTNRAVPGCRCRGAYFLRRSALFRSLNGVVGMVAPTAFIVYPLLCQ